MKYSQVLVGAAVASLASAHSTIYNMWLNGVDQGVGNSAAGYIRSPPNSNPVKDVTSKDMTCNVNNAATAKTIDVKAGDKLTMEWHHSNNSPEDDIIDKTHVGPVMAYIAPTASNGAGDVWVKLAEDGYDGSKWAVEKLIANKGKYDVTLPSSLADGEYLVRGEIIALHEADTDFATNPGRGAQFYMECIQISVSGGGATVLPAGVSIPGAYKHNDPGVLFNLFAPFTSYKIPGPAVWNAASSGTSPKPSTTKPIVSGAGAAKPSTPAAANATPKPVDTNVPSSALVPVTKVPGTIPAPAISSKSACKPKTSTVTPKPSKAACTAKTSAAAPKPTKSKCTAKTSTAAPKPTKSKCTGKKPTTLATVTKPAAPTGPAAPANPGAAVALYGQCGGINYTGSKTCASGSTCKDWNPYYSQCIAA